MWCNFSVIELQKKIAWIATVFGSFIKQVTYQHNIIVNILGFSKTILAINVNATTVNPLGENLKFPLNILHEHH